MPLHWGICIQGKVEAAPLLQGDRVKLTLTFKGREMQFQDIGKDLFKVRSLHGSSSADSITAAAASLHLTPSLLPGHASQTAFPTST